MEAENYKGLGCNEVQSQKVVKMRSFGQRDKLLSRKLFSEMQQRRQKWA